MKDLNIVGVVIARAVCSLFLLITSAAYGQTPGQQAWTILQSGAADSNTEHRVATITALALIQGDAKAVSMAEGALKDQDPYVRKAAAGTLGILKAKSAVPQLHAALSDKDGEVVMSAAKALITIGNESGYGVYYALVTGERKSGESLIGSQEQEMEQVLHNPRDMAEMAFEQGIGYVPFGGIGWGAFQAIHKNETKEVLVKANAIRVLAKDPDPRSEKALVSGTQDEHWLVRAASYDAIARRGDPTLLTEVTKGLTDQQDVARLAAAAAVAQLSTLSKK